MSHTFVINVNTSKYSKSSAILEKAVWTLSTRDQTSRLPPNTRMAES